MAVNNTNKGEGSQDGSLNFDYTLLTAYIDNELSPEQKAEVEKAIAQNEDIRIRYELEKRTKNLLAERLKRIETPQYLYKSVYDAIDDYSARVATTAQQPSISAPHYTTAQNKRSSSKKYIYAFGSLFVVLFLAFIAVNFVFNRDAVSSDKDMVALSHDIFGKVAKGEVKIEYPTSDPKALENFFKDKADFKVFVPNVRNASLMGGVYSEVNGMKVVHFIHKKDTVVIYTFQTSLKNVMDDGNDKVMLTGDFKDRVRKGDNWFPCGKKKDRNESGVVWFKDGVICCSVAYMNPQDIRAELTNFK
jgi:hypothetical protein